MKKILVSLLFFGSFGLAMAQLTPGGTNDPYHLIWNPPVPNPNSCGTHEEREMTVKEKHCESPWSHTAPNPIPLNEMYIFPSGTIWPAYKAFLNTHTGILFTDPTKSSCNNFSASESVCNSATLKGKKKPSLGASLYSAWRAFLGVPSINPQSVVQGISQAISAATDGYEFTRGCEWYEKRIDTMVTKENKCFSDVCIDVDMRMQRIQMEIHGLNQKLSSSDLDAGTKAEIRATIERLKKVLLEESLSCNANKACISDTIGMDPSGSGEDSFVSCRPKPLCPCPSPAGIPENNPKCRPNPYCMRQQ